MTLTREDVRNVAMLARLGLEEGEEGFYVEQLGAILAHIDRLREVDTEAIPPTSQAVPCSRAGMQVPPPSSHAVVIIRL